jgi:hypothetical protein
MTRTASPVSNNTVLMRSSTYMMFSSWPLKYGEVIAGWCRGGIITRLPYPRLTTFAPAPVASRRTPLAYGTITPHTSAPLFIPTSHRPLEHIESCEVVSTSAHRGARLLCARLTLHLPARNKVRACRYWQDSPPRPSRINYWMRRAARMPSGSDYPA